MRVLLLEDDDALQGAVERRLRSSGFAVDVAGDIPEAEMLLAINTYDCLILDRAVPSGDSMSLLERIRVAGDTTSALFLTAKDSIAQRVEGFETGADDYLVKPFAMAELVARVRRLARRTVMETATVVNLGDLTLNQARAEVHVGGVLVPLTPKELAVLTELATRPDTVVTRTQLIEACWDEMYDPMSNTVDVHVASLRRKLGPELPITTVRGLGYRLDTA